MSSPTARDHNTISVLGAVLAGAPITRNQVMALTGLSKATVSRAVEELRIAGLVVDGDVDSVVGRGRRSTYLDLARNAGHVAGVSFGVQDTRLLVTDLRGRAIVKESHPTPGLSSAAEAGAWLTRHVRRASAAADGALRQVVVAVPATVRAGAEVVRPPAALGFLAGTALHDAMQRKFEVPVSFDSDANAALLGTLAEEDIGVRGDAVLFSVSSVFTVAACVDRQLVRGHTAAFGELGVLPAGVGEETLGRLLSSRGLLDFARRQGLRLQRIEHAWTRTPPGSEDVVRAFTSAVIAAVGVVAVTLDPATVLFTGRLAPLVEKVLPQVRDALASALPIVPAIMISSTRELGLSTIRGAAEAGIRAAHRQLRDHMLTARSKRLYAEAAGPYLS
ncbi:ROK family transcriptional regulator [Amycolatopsis pithecellobii]|uniref:ROK family protein n=1 Tax=Amycolatopsis pithecellobii TaxID=664692 RepID=A0A6N7YUB8_9PSEU|nr:ROK family transcriptional regulator [Amycolatopsis pithecellobii]MTD52453.1 ROK family protein [Amycolatopsis pithecellobii]